MLSDPMYPVFNDEVKQEYAGSRCMQVPRNGKWPIGDGLQVIFRYGWEEGNGTPLQYSCLENPMDGGAWQAAVHGVAQSRTRPSDFTFTFPFMHWRRKWQPTPGFLPGESQGRGSLVGCRLWGRTELDTTEVTQQQQQIYYNIHNTLKTTQLCS